MSDLELFRLDVSDLCTAEEARALTDRIKVVLDGTWELVKAAYTSRAWAVLGYATWDDYCTREFGSSRLKLPREERGEVVDSLRASGLSLRAIATATGLGVGTIRRELAEPTVPFGTVGETADDAEPAAATPPATPFGSSPRVQGVNGKSYQAFRPAPQSWPTSIPNRPPASPPWQAPPASAPIHSEPSMFDDPEIVDAEIVDEAPYSQPVTTAPAAPIDPEAAWSDEERGLVKRLRDGETVVLSLRGAHANLIRWAEFNGLYVRIDRRSDWGNPFELPGDGDRNTVIRNYAEHYLPHKPSLLARMSDLRGKALGCWCAPDACHGDVLKEKSDA